MNKYYLSIFAFLFIFSACGSQESATAEATSEKESTGTSCLGAMNLTPCNILSLSEIAQLTGIAESEIEMEPPHSSLSNPEYMQCNFSWPSDRTTIFKMLSITQEIPVSNSINVGSVKVITEEVLERLKQTRSEYFEKRYTNITAEQKAQVKEKLSEELADKSDAEKDMGSALIAMASNFNYVPVNNIGDRASWETRKEGKDASLHVQHKDVIFRVNVNISDDTDESLEMAKKVALAVLAKCN